VKAGRALRRKLRDATLGVGLAGAAFGVSVQDCMNSASASKYSSSDWLLCKLRDATLGVGLAGAAHDSYTHICLTDHSYFCVKLRLLLALATYDNSSCDAALGVGLAGAARGFAVLCHFVSS
jgi:hypothetical protein